MPHTPGPWHLVDQKLRPQFDVRILEIQDSRFEAVVAWGGFDGVRRSKAETKANASLIAAAPELLDACRLTALHFARMAASDNFMGDDEHEAWNALTAAIAKAKGEA